MAKRMKHDEQSNFEITSKRRKGFPSETQVGRGERVVHGDKHLQDKLGRNDLCPCGSGYKFPELLPAFRQIRRKTSEPLFLGSRAAVAYCEGRLA